MNEPQLRSQMLRISHLIYDRGLLVAMDGNLSALLPSGHVLCTRAGCHKGFLTDEDLIVVDRNGRMLRGTGRPTSELKMHLACYDERPDIRAVVHAHPPISVAFTIANVSMARCVLPEVVLTLGTIPTVDYETTGTLALADKIRPFVRDHDAILMDRHGAVCLGGSLLQAFCNLETMEHTAKITKTALALGGVKELPPEEAVKLRSLGLKRYGGPPSAVEKADQPGADLPVACQPCSTAAANAATAKTSRATSAADTPKAPLRMARIVDTPPRMLAGSVAGDVEDAVMKAVLEALGR
jgi:L-fuculose-phosphate aldolase